jgi:hypothetical protein
MPEARSPNAPGSPLQGLCLSADYVSLHTFPYRRLDPPNQIVLMPQLLQFEGESSLIAPMQLGSIVVTVVRSQDASGA